MLGCRHVPGIRTMVTYQRWTQIAFDVAESKGFQTGQESNRELISVVADIWRDRKDDLSAARVSEARDIAEDEIRVS